MSDTTTLLSTANVIAAVQAGIAVAVEMEKRFTIAVLDEGGNERLVVRMEGAILGSLQVARDKAYTAVAFGRPTSGWFDVLEADEPLGKGARTGIDRLVTFGGGLPVRLDGRLVAGIGVSGAHYSDDERVAQAVVDHLTAVTA
jgi:uncharacterized protein GlcG (DUF336 family)